MAKKYLLIAALIIILFTIGLALLINPRVSHDSTLPEPEYGNGREN